MAKDELISPILKWVGGKRQLLSEIIPLIPEKYSTYVEPFVGGGAVFFELQPKKAIINDMNSELINVYRVIRDKSDELIEILETHAANHNEDYFYKIRSLDREEGYNELDDVTKAARIIYLNKTCYNGLYRVNASGQFNTPFGRYKNPKIVDSITIKAMSKYLKRKSIRICEGDYKQVLKTLRKPAFVYLDPPYQPLSASSSFTSYTGEGFSFEDQKELKVECDKLRKKGISFVQSNSDCPEIRELYSDYKIITVKAKRNINSKGNARGEINEVLIYYDREEEK